MTRVVVADDSVLLREGLVRLLEELGAISAAAEGLFAYSAKIVCGKQTDASCCCTAGVRPGVYATEVNIQNLNLVTAPVLKFVLPLINSGAVVAREPNVADPVAALRGRPVEVVKLPPLGATMDDCCRISELLLGAIPRGDAPLTIATTKFVIGQVVKEDSKRDLDKAAEMVKRCFESKDYVEGRRAFMEKRKPAFTGS